MANGEAWAVAQEAGVKWPESLAAPEIIDGFGGWYEDFWELDTERVNGGPIPSRAIDLHVTGWRYDDADMFRAIIRAMDSTYRGVANKTETAEPPQNARDAFRGATVGRRR